MSDLNIVSELLLGCTLTFVGAIILGVEVVKYTSLALADYRATLGSYLLGYFPAMEGLVGASDRLKEVLWSARLVPLIVAAEVQDDDVEDVAAEAETRRGQHNFAVDGLRI